MTLVKLSFRFAIILFFSQSLNIFKHNQTRPLIVMVSSELLSLNMKNYGILEGPVKILEIRDSFRRTY